MIDNEKQFKQVLEVLNNEGILDNVILIGSWCLLLYKTIFENFEPNIRTIDVDFFIPDVKSIKEKSCLIKSFKDINYDIVHDTLTKKSTFISPDGFELEFLTKLNRKQLTCVKVGDTNIFAESLSYVDIFVSNYIIVNYGDLLVKVASPGSYVLQKLLINKYRSTKSEKDIASVRHVLQYIEMSKKYKDDFVTLYISLPKKWKKIVDETAVINQIKLL